MKIPGILTFFLLLVSVSNAQAVTNFGGEIVSYNTFGEGMMVTRAKVATHSGTVSNMFFFNRADEPWIGDTWYEYDWEIRGTYPFAGWSQIRVREQGDAILKDAPLDVSTTTNLGDELLHYILIRTNNHYVYDIRRDFKVSTYNYNRTEEHDGNSESLLSNGPRIYETGEKLRHIPSWKQLDFSLGVTAFGSKWSGALPTGDYSGEMEVDFARFYSYADETLNTDPEWSDEFDGSSLDFGKWYTANWRFAATQFRQENIKVKDGRLFLRVNRGESYWAPSASVEPVNLNQIESVTPSTRVVPETHAASNTLQPLPEVPVTDNVPESRPEVEVTGNIPESPREVQVTGNPSEPPPEIQVKVNTSNSSLSTDALAQRGNPIGTGSSDTVTLWILAAAGLLTARRRKLCHTTARAD